MKIKEVQISNFRAFNDIKCSTFNFTNDNGEISDLISIYAPNGFGKTSFYDAVEWGVTGKIERFDLVGDFEKIRKENKKGGNKNILQHVGATELGFVNVITDNSKFNEKITTSEYNHKKPVKNKFFKDVVLSQEMIDNFLKEQTAEERYNKFVESYPDVSKYNNTYKNLLSLLRWIGEEVKRIDKDKKGVEDRQLEIDFDLEFKKFDQINEAIQFLNSKNEKISTVEKDTFDETLNEILTSQIKSRLVSLEDILIRTRLRIDNIRLAIQGDGNTPNSGLINFLENKKKLEGFEKTINELINVISLINDREKVQNEINNLKGNSAKTQGIISEFLEIEKKIDVYLKLNAEVINHEKRISDFNQNNVDIKSENTKINESNLDLKNKISQLNDELKQVQSKLNNLPSQKEKFELVKNKFEPLAKELNDISNSKAEKDRAFEALKLKISQLNYYENKVLDDIEILYELAEFEKQKPLIEKIKKLQEAQRNKNIELLAIEDEINTQNQFNNELKNFVTNGLNIINQSNSSECPLCTQAYKSFEELSNRVIGNKFLGDFLKEKLEFKVKVEEEIRQVVELLNFNLESLKKQINEQIKPFKNDLLRLEKEVNKLVIQEQEKRIELEIIQNSSNEVSLFFNNEIDILSFENNLKEKIGKIKEEVSGLSLRINSDLSKINENQNRLKSNNDNVEILKVSISKIKSLEEFHKVKMFFNEHLNTTEITKIVLGHEKRENETKLLKLKNELEEKQELLQNLAVRLANYKLSKEEYINKVEEVEKSKTMILNFYEYYESFIRTEFGIDIKNKEKGLIEVEFDKLIQNEKNSQKDIEDKIERLKIINALKDDCLKANESKRTLDEIEDLRKKILMLKEVEKKLVKEKGNLEIYLKKTIDEFFYTDLINAIYKKIDPHPDYNSIEFNCEFGDNKPRLQIFTNKINDAGEIIKSVPALYFSTAQINILSLSIFLARALKSKNPKTGESIDCVFIDDPIQSMDSINILSFIDLFRGIIASLGKQLIVSTHEENFHLLLQKKIPKELFKSKFIEFETFGKLKLER